MEKKKQKSSFDHQLEEILYFMMNQEEFIKIYQTRLGIFPTKETRAIANEIIYYYETNKTINIADFITYAETTNVKQEIMDIIENITLNDLTEEAMEELINIIKKKTKEQEIKEFKYAYRNRRLTI